MQRLTISLDDDLARQLDELQEAHGDSKANLIRRALRTSLRQRGAGERPTEEDLRVWTELLANREHVIMDVAHVRVLFEALTDAPASFWEELKEVGSEHGRQYRDKGLSSPEDILRVMESANWFHLAPETDRSWALILTEPSAKPFVQAFLEGFFLEIEGRPEVLSERTKLRVRVPPARARPRPPRDAASS